MSSAIVITNIDRESLVVNGLEIEITGRGAFRGFKHVPAGKHLVENNGTKLEVEIGDSEAQLYVWDPETQVNTRRVVN